MIPRNRPVYGKDLETIKQQLGLLTADACWLFGLSITRWTKIVRQCPEDPVRDPTIAMLVRFLDQHPECSLIPTFPGVEEMFEMINEIEPTDQKRFSVIFASEASAAYRWRQPDGRQSPAVARLMLCMKLALQARDRTEQKALLDDWKDALRDEAYARGVERDVLETGKWAPRGETAADDEQDEDESVDVAPKSKAAKNAKSTA